MELEVGGQKFEVRGLTWAEIKRLDEEGHNFCEIKLEFMADSEPISKIFRWTCPGLDINRLTPGEIKGVFYQILKLTFDRPEIKGKVESSTGEGDTGEDPNAKDAGPIVH